MKKLFSLLLLVPLTGCLNTPHTGKASLENWAPETSPVAVGYKVANRFLAQPHSEYGRMGNPTEVTYPDVCTWYGCLEFAKVRGDSALTRRLADRFEPLFGPEARLIPQPVHVDFTVFGALPLELYLQTGDKRCLALGKEFADKQWTRPEGKYDTEEARALLDRGLSWQSRFWIDDMFMITMVQAQAYRATGEQDYIDRAAREMVVYLDRLQKTNGLFFHATNAPLFWGRGNGWMAAGMTELLRALPKDNTDRPRILQGYRSMMASLLHYQRPDGMWGQLIDDPKAWPETSCSAMFTFAMITGAKNGWLDASVYGPAARKAWTTLVTYIEPNGDLRDVCEGTGTSHERDYYLERQRHTGNLHGQAPVIWCATALLRKAE